MFLLEVARRSEYRTAAKQMLDPPLFVVYSCSTS